MEKELIEYFLYDLESCDFDLLNQEYEYIEENKIHVIKKIKGTNIKISFPKVYGSCRIVNLPEFVCIQDENPNDLSKVISKQGQKRLRNLALIQIESHKDHINGLNEQIVKLEKLI